LIIDLRCRQIKYKEATRTIAPIAAPIPIPAFVPVLKVESVELRDGDDEVVIGVEDVAEENDVIDEEIKDCWPSDDKGAVNNKVLVEEVFETIAVNEDINS